jgi:hypothetical protein
MFDSETRGIASSFLECALMGKTGQELIDCVKRKFPVATAIALRRAAFLAVTHGDACREALPAIHAIGIMLTPGRHDASA